MENRVKDPLIVAHRGASHDAPENTLAAFRLAWRQNADAIEGDFRLTSDHQIVCFHDPDTSALCPNQPVMKIAESDLKSLQQLNVVGRKGNDFAGAFAGEKIPTLASVLEMVPPGKQFFVEIKTGTEILPYLIEQLEHSTLAPEQIVLISFQADVIRRARQLIPQYRANWLAKYESRSTDGRPTWQPDIDDVLATLADTDSTGLGSQNNVAVVDQAFVSAVTDAGKEFHVWTVDDPQIATQLKSFGVHSLTTNRPEFLRSNMDQTTKSSQG